jgi:cellulose synthase/poly-beta-1,6-N-acetylglucosamine synthase-like glycosyltransferase
VADVTTAPAATVLVPARNGEAGLITALEAIRRAAVGVQQGVEILVVTPENFSEMSFSPDVRWLRTPGRGKFAALVTGARAASSENLILVDADIVPEADAFRHLLAPILSGEADICAGHLRVAQRPGIGPIGALLERWAAVSWEAWHRLRMATPASCWALPGGLYALRRTFLPESTLCATVDDASIGLHAKGAGARFSYAPDALAWVLAPSTYRDWVRQKLRSRLGWAALARHRPLDVAVLQEEFRGHFAEVIAGRSHTQRRTGADVTDPSPRNEATSHRRRAGSRPSRSPTIRR